MISRIPSRSQKWHRIKATGCTLPPPAEGKGRDKQAIQSRKRKMQRYDHGGIQEPRRTLLFAPVGPGFPPRSVLSVSSSFLLPETEAG